MKLIIALAAAGIVSSLAVITPAQAQKNSACVEKCDREIAYSRGGPQDIRSVGNRRSACIRSLSGGGWGGRFKEEIVHCSFLAGPFGSTHEQVAMRST